MKLPSYFSVRYVILRQRFRNYSKNTATTAACTYDTYLPFEREKGKNGGLSSKTGGNLVESGVRRRCGRVTQSVGKSRLGPIDKETRARISLYGLKAATRPDPSFLNVPCYEVQQCISLDDTTPPIVLAPCHSAEYLLIPLGNEQMFPKNDPMHVRTVPSFTARTDDINDAHQSSYG